MGGTVDGEETGKENSDAFNSKRTQPILAESVKQQMVRILHTHTIRARATVSSFVTKESSALDTRCPLTTTASCGRKAISWEEVLLGVARVVTSKMICLTDLKERWRSS